MQIRPRVPIWTLKKLFFRRSVTMAAQSTRFDLPGFTLPLDYNVSTMNMKFHNALDRRDIEGGCVK